MTRLTLIVCVLLLTATTSFAQEHGSPSKDTVPKVTPPAIARPNNWIDYNSPEGRYRVSLPREPKLSTQESTNNSGLKFTQYMAAVEDSGRLFMIGYFDFPAAFDLDKARDGVIEKLKATLLNESAISLGGYPGREIKLSAKESDGTEYLVVARIYAVKDRAYFVQFITARSDTAAAGTQAAARYFDSFSVSVP